MKKFITKELFYEQNITKEKFDELMSGKSNQSLKRKRTKTKRNKNPTTIELLNQLKFLVS